MVISMYKRVAIVVHSGEIPRLPIPSRISVTIRDITK